MSRYTCYDARIGATRQDSGPTSEAQKGRQFVKDDACATWRAPPATSPTFSQLFLAPCGDVQGLNHLAALELCTPHSESLSFYV